MELLEVELPFSRKRMQACQAAFSVLLDFLSRRSDRRKLLSFSARAADPRARSVNVLGCLGPLDEVECSVRLERTRESRDQYLMQETGDSSVTRVGDECV